MKRQQRSMMADENDFQFPILPTFPQTRTRIFGEGITNVNILNEKIIDSHHRRLYEDVRNFSRSPDETCRSNGSSTEKIEPTYQTSFTCEATLLVDESFSFIDRELSSGDRPKKFGVDGQSLQIGNSAEFTPRIDSESCSSSTAVVANALNSDNSEDDREERIDDEYNIDNEPYNDQSGDKSIIRCRNADGEVCAVYEKRRNIDNGNQPRPRRQPAVSFDDRIVIVDGNDQTSLGDVESPSSIDQETGGPLRRFRQFFRRDSKKPGSIDYQEPPGGGRSSAPIDDQSKYSGGGYCDKSVSSTASLCDFQRSFFDPTMYSADRLKINPIYEECQDGTAAKTVERFLEPVYCDPVPLDRYTGQTGMYYDHPHLSVRTSLQQTSKNKARLDFDQLRTKKFGLAVTVMVIVLALSGIGIGLTIYWD